MDTGSDNMHGSSGSAETFSVCASEGDPDRQESIAARNLKVVAVSESPGLAASCLASVRSIGIALSDSGFGGTIYRGSS